MGLVVSSLGLAVLMKSVSTPAPLRNQCLRNMMRDAHHATIWRVIVSIRHKGLRVLFEKGGTRGVKPQRVRKLRLQLVALHTATTSNDMNIPGWRLHQLRGSRASTWSITVDQDWRLTFEFSDGNVYLLDYKDYH